MSFKLSEEELTTLATYEVIAQKWDERAGPRYKDMIWRMFLKGLPQSARIIDLGCGTALPNAEFVLSEGFRYFGIDISEKMLVTARKNLVDLHCAPEEALKLMDMRHLEFADETFDGFLSVTSFMHLPRNTVSIALRETMRVLRKKGKGIISISHGTFEGLYTPPSTSLPVYVVSWQPEQFEELLQQAGFTFYLAQAIESMLVYVVEKPA